MPEPGRIVILSPSGRPLTPELAATLAEEEHITLICGRYEGIDERLKNSLGAEEISVCPVVLNGGETAAMVLVEAVARFVPGFMGCDDSATEESFSTGLLEYPHYTRPDLFMDMPVPEILRSGDHARIAAWRRAMALARTLAIRPEMLNSAPLTEQDAECLAAMPRLRPARNLSFCLMHHPVILEGRRVGTSSLTNLDIHDIARISLSYGMGPFYVFTPLRDQLDLLKRILEHWVSGPGMGNRDRRDALGLVRPVADLSMLEDMVMEHYGKKPVFLATSAAWPKKRECLTCEDVRALSLQGPVIICLGTARGLDLKSLPFEYRQLRPIRFLDVNHLSVRSAAAIIADRIAGDFY